MGLFLFLDPQQIKQSYLRLLVYVMPLSELYDCFWLYEKSDEYYEDQSENGMEQVILLAVVFLIFYKIILMVVLWKASLNFEKFVK